MLMNPDQEQAWKELIVEHSQFPRGHHELTEPSHLGQGENPLCGDRVTVQLSVDEQGRIARVACQSSGCAISIASASLLAEHVEGSSVEEALALFGQVHGLMTAAEAGQSPGLGPLEALRLVRLYPSRVKCATLAWHTLRHTLLESGGTATTE